MNEITEDSVQPKFEITFERTFKNCFCLFMSLLIMAPFNNNEKLYELVKVYPFLYNFIPFFPFFIEHFSYAKTSL